VDEVSVTVYRTDTVREMWTGPDCSCCTGQGWMEFPPPSKDSAFTAWQADIC